MFRVDTKRKKKFFFFGVEVQNLKRLLSRSTKFEVQIPVFLHFFRPNDRAPVANRAQDDRETLFKYFERLGSIIGKYWEGKESKRLLLTAADLRELRRLDASLPAGQRHSGLRGLIGDVTVVIPPWAKNNLAGESFSQYNWKWIAFIHNLFLQLMFFNKDIPDNKSWQWTCGGHPA